MTDKERIRREKIRKALLGRVSPMKGRKQSKKAIRLISLAMKGRRLSPEARLKVSMARRGSNHWNWQGGVSNINRRIRNTGKYIEWRRAVFERDNYTCIVCGIRNRKGLGKTVALHADHIKPFYRFKDLRFDISNGRTLCVPCHRKTETWGRPKKLLTPL